jgi:hypothetical protein
MSAVRNQNCYVLFFRRFRNTKSFDNFYRPPMSAESALRLATNSGVGMKPQPMRVTLLSRQVIAVAPPALGRAVLRIRPPFLHILPAACPPSLNQLSANRSFSLRRDFHWNRLPFPSHGSSSQHSPVTHSTHPPEVLRCFYSAPLGYIPGISIFISAIAAACDCAKPVEKSVPDTHLRGITPFILLRYVLLVLLSVRSHSILRNFTIRELFHDCHAAARILDHLVSNWLGEF